MCDRCYRTAALLRAHRRRHTSDVSRHVCEVCGRTFMYQSNLQVHSAVHTTDRAFSCSTCGKSYKTASTLNTHMVVHRSDTTATSHVCTECGKAFKTKQRLRAHEFRHSGMKPHVCRSCGGSFPDRGGLAKHLRTVHASRALYSCPSCGKTANRLDNLRVHMRTHGDPDLVKLSAEQLTISNPINLISDKQTPAVPTPIAVAPTSSVSINTSVPAAPISAFCLLPGKTDRDLSKYIVSSSGSVAGNGPVDLFQDSNTYVQHCLSFVALPAADYVAQTDVLTTQSGLPFIQPD